MITYELRKYNGSWDLVAVADDLIVATEATFYTNEALAQTVLRLLNDRGTALCPPLPPHVHYTTTLPICANEFHK